MSNNITVGCGLCCAGVIFIYGIIAYAIDFPKILELDQTNKELFKFATLGLVHLWISMLLGVPAQIYQNYKSGLDPRVRKKWSYLFTLINSLLIIWNFTYFIMMLNGDYFNKLSTPMSDVANLIHVYLIIIFVFITISVVIYCLAALFACCALTIMGCSKCIEGGPSRGSLPNLPPGFFYRARPLRPQPSPNPYQLEQKTQTDSFSNFMSIFGLRDKVETDCAICTSEFDDSDELRKLPCLHFFHKDCVDKWLENHNSCPLCRQEISTGKSKYAPAEINV